MRFKCTHAQCGKSFKRKDYLFRHEANHSLVKPFVCEICDTSFARKDLIEKHRRSKAHQRAAEHKRNGRHNVFVNSFLEGETVANLPLAYKQVENQESIAEPAPLMAHLAAPVTPTLPDPTPPLVPLMAPTALSSIAPNNNNNNNDLPPAHPAQVVDTVGANHLVITDDHNLDLVMNFDKFSNFANAMEDSYDWLFGDEQRQMLNEKLLAEPEPFNHPNNDVEYETDKEDFPITDTTLSELLQVLHNEIGMDSTVNKLITAANVNFYLHHYWSYFDSSYPVVHKPTFNVNGGGDIHCLLILSMIAMGIAYVKPDSQIFTNEYSLAIEIERKIGLSLFNKIQSFTSLENVPMKLLQSLILTDAFFTYFGTDNQHSISHIYHPMVVNLFKELGLYVGLPEPLIDSNLKVTDETWRQWIHYESLKRLAFFGYLLDTQKTFLFTKNKCVSVFDIQLDLPYTDSVWFAENCEVFWEFYNKQPKYLTQRSKVNQQDSQMRYEITHDELVSNNGNLIPNVKNEGRWPNFLWSIRRLMQPFSQNQREYHMNCFSQFSRYIFLHGVLSLVNELRSSTIFDMKILPTSRLNLIAAKIEHSFFGWRDYFHYNIDQAYKASIGKELMIPISLNDYSALPLFWANITIHNIGLLGLYCNIDLIMQQRKHSAKADEAHRLFESSPGRLRYHAIQVTKNDMMLSSWAKSKDGKHALREACTLLRTIFSNETVVSMVPHIPFTIYISTLVCWIYEWYQVSTENGNQPHFNHVQFHQHTFGTPAAQNGHPGHPALHEEPSGALSVPVDGDDQKISETYLSRVLELPLESSEAAAFAGYEQSFEMAHSLVKHASTVLKRSTKWVSCDYFVTDLEKLIENI